ncbi:RibD Pyrimidine deaminase [uncultured Caudovirales phage]|uniref:RibD Pyrimidine deaminase n=1 Tax=uncultured Caudovirales phage TaxID=2100421 RepID=A0A6J5LJI8_9CAUD|nr:RibD Pyrimidine deaminase [uncultured Caudovirales phage]
MRASDYEIKNLDKLDNILVDLCRMVVEGQKNNPEHYGMVAAAVVDNDNNIVARLNIPVGEKRMHAEHVALNAYRKKYGEPPDGSIVVTTCSPCSEEMTERYGISCTDMINKSNIHKVYCGYIDPSQSEEQRTFTLQESNNQHIRDLCKKFADTFL